MEPQLTSFGNSFVRISTVDGIPVGAGFIVSERHVLTCAHVVAAALRMSYDTSEKPQGGIHLDFPFLQAAACTAHVEDWLPPSGPSTNPSGDIAVLRLTTALPDGAQPAYLTATRDLFGRSFRAHGYPRGYDAGVFAYGVLRDQLGNGWLQVEDTKGTGRRIEPGFSGSPVEDQETGRIIGMVVASTGEKIEKVGFVIPADVLANAYPAIEVDQLREATPKRRLAEMPLDKVPDLAPLPQTSRVLFSHNSLFVGREEQLKNLAKIFMGDAESQEQVVAAAVTGIGGMGKSQLASEFVHHYGQYFSGGVFWLSFADPNAVPAEVAACGGAKGMKLDSHFRSLPLEDQTAQVMSEWESELPRLLVFDNCEDENLLKQWRPSHGGCRVLVTCRRQPWSRVLGVRIVHLEELSPEESVELLRRYSPDLPEDAAPDLHAIADELGNLPLAIELAGSFLDEYRHSALGTPVNYLGQLRKPDLLKHPSLQEDKGISPTDHERSVARTFAVSYEQLHTTNPVDALAEALLARVTRFAPGEPVPRELLLKTLKLPKDDDQAPYRAETALHRLANLGLLQEHKEGALRMHRLVAAFVDGVVDDEEAQEAVEAALADTLRPLVAEHHPARLLELLPHLRVVTDAARDRKDELAADLCIMLGYCLRVVGASSEARPLYERALTIREDLLGPDHPDTAAILGNLAVLLAGQGDLEGAHALRKRELDINEKVHGKEHPDTAASLNNLAVLLDAQGSYDKKHYEEARPLYERALAIREKVLGEDHPDTAITLDNLGAMLAEQGNYGEARSLLERALAINEKVHGEEHPYTAISLDRLGAMLADQGDYQRARSLHEEALAIREKVHGKEHPYTAITLDNLASVLEDQSDYNGARSYYERALAIREKALGEDHPDTAVTLNNLAAMLGEQGRYDEARSYYERALAIREKALGEDHPDTKVLRQNLRSLPSSQRPEPRR